MDSDSVTEKEGQPIIEFAGPADLERWLDDNGGSATGVWLKLAKKDTGVTTITYAEAVNVILRYGWIDAKASKLDDTYWLQRLTPRNRRSRWSVTNRATVEKMIEAGTMTPAGMREVDSAKADGRWAAAYDVPSTATVPDDLQSELDANPTAAATFAALSAANRYAILFQIQEAKKPETRARRITKFLTKLAAGEKRYP